jgi:ribosomal protein S18 acetylase RimI-like enzyme
VLAPALKRLEVRAAREEDLAAAFALLQFEQTKNPWVGRIPEMLTASIDDPARDYRACVGIRDGELIGFGICGMVAGAAGTGTIYSVLVAPRSRRAGIGQRLLFHMVTELENLGARVIFAEMPADTCIMRYRALLISYGFMEESRIEDYYRDGVPQIISRFKP